MIQSYNFIDINHFILNTVISNTNKNNWLQQDQPIIKNIIISNNSVPIEEIYNYNIVIFNINFRYII